MCGLWVQQTYSQEVFQKVDAQPCRGFPSQGPRFWPELHPSHIWLSTGKTWECSGCGVSFGPAVARVPNKATKLCNKSCLGNKLSFAKASFPRTEAQTGSSSFVNHEGAAPAKATGSGTPNHPRLQEAPFFPKQEMRVTGCKAFFVKTTDQASTLQPSVPGPEAPLSKTVTKVSALFAWSVNSKALPVPKLPSSGVTEVLDQEQQPQSSSGVLQPKAPAVSLGSMTLKAPPKPRPPSSAVTEVSEGQGECATSGRGTRKLKAPPKAQRAKQHSRPARSRCCCPL